MFSLIDDHPSYLAQKPFSFDIAIEVPVATSNWSLKQRSQGIKKEHNKSAVFYITQQWGKRVRNVSCWLVQNCFSYIFYHIQNR